MIIDCDLESTMGSDYEFIYILNKISVPTRYPEDLQKLFSLYPKDKTEDIFNKTKKL
jgi:hypothetical protein